MLVKILLRDVNLCIFLFIYFILILSNKFIAFLDKKIEDFRIFFNSFYSFYLEICKAMFVDSASFWDYIDLSHDSLHDIYYWFKFRISLLRRHCRIVLNKSKLKRRSIWYKTSKYKNMVFRSAAKYVSDHVFFKLQVSFFSSNFNNIFYLRRNRVFLKCKFSRVRLFNRTIVIFGLLLNIIFVFELNLVYYNILINFGYLISGVYLLVLLVSLKILLNNNFFFKLWR